MGWCACSESLGIERGEGQKAERRELGTDGAEEQSENEGKFK